jgi:succinylglutamate desuccinylase
MKILILGHGRHGKDTVAELLEKLYGLTFQSSSYAAARKVVFPALAEKYGYRDFEECFDDRANHRQEWMELISAYNTPDKGRLCKEILETSHMYVGMRCDQEYAATRNLFDLVIWVDRGEKQPLDPTMKISYDATKMFWLDNNDSTYELLNRVREKLGVLLFMKKEPLEEAA